MFTNHNYRAIAIFKFDFLQGPGSLFGILKEADLASKLYLDPQISP